MAKFLSSWPTDFTNGNPVYKLFKLLSWNKSTVKWFQHTVKTRKSKFERNLKCKKLDGLTIRDEHWTGLGLDWTGL